MELLTHVSIDLFPIVMLLIIYFNDQDRKTKTKDRYQFDELTLFTMCLMIVDIFSNGLRGAKWSGITGVLWIMYLVHVILLVVVAYVWLMYVCYRLNAKESLRHYRGITRGVLWLSVVFGAAAVTTPWTHLLFRITENGGYERSRGYFLTYVVSSAVLLMSVMIAAVVYRCEASKELRRESLYMVVCGIVPLIGFGIQNMFHGWWIGGPSVALSILFIYINTQNRQISTDGLTGLNTRGEFDGKLKKRTEAVSAEDWGLLMLDIDDFKEINDLLGHDIGDDALWQTADILRRTMGHGKTFLARYGGDEFAVIGNWKKHDDAKRAIDEIQTEVQRFNETSQKSYQLSFSIGHALWSEAKDIETLIAKADERMYAEKCLKKKLAGKKSRR